MRDSLPILQDFTGITLDEMKGVKLMNRIDTKYITSLEKLPAILEKAKVDYFVQDTAGLRIAQYDTLYFDTADLDMYVRHHNQHLTRQKIRIREYKTTHNVFLEVKRKTNRGRTKKKRWEVPALSGAVTALQTVDFTPEMNAFIEKKSAYDVRELTPQLGVHFQRITLVNRTHTERLTIDTNIRWENIQTGQKAGIENLVVIELKRDGRTLSPMQHILRDLRIMPYKISKYCIGTVLTNPNVKANRFKQKLHYIRKLTM